MVLQTHAWIKTREDGSEYLDRTLFVNTLGFLFGGIQLPSYLHQGEETRDVPNIPWVELLLLLRLGILRLSGGRAEPQTTEFMQRRGLVQQLPEAEIHRPVQKLGKAFADWPRKWEGRPEFQVNTALRQAVLKAEAVFTQGQEHRDFGFTYWRVINLRDYGLIQPKIADWSGEVAGNQDGLLDRERRMAYRAADELAQVGSELNEPSLAEQSQVIGRRRR